MHLALKPQTSPSQTESPAAVGPNVVRYGRREDQPWWVKSRGAVGIAILVPFGCVAFFIDPWSAPGTLATLAWDSAGWLLLLAGIVFRFWATAYIGGHKGEQVIAQGPYSLCRNPLYFGNFLIALSIGVFLQSLVFTLGVLMASGCYLFTTVRTEERELSVRFGQEYLAYCRRVPRFWPRWFGLETPSRIDVDVRCLRIEAFRSLRLTAIPFVVHLVPILRAVFF
jgi:protein-S-isoprenylcysteine O-methyltransferase Ste14